ncbi:MAG: SIMPL domain-containing protein [Candidatus Promineifilaceae bacterium]|nr:SIMPL domain-containing protein [Candidatus Promineifilaceae bacterium]
MKRWIYAALIAASAILALGLLTVAGRPQAASAQTDGVAAGAERMITVSGVGSIEAEPDTAIVRLGVETQADTAEAALDQNSEQMQGVIEALTEAEIAEEDIQTSGLRLQPIYDEPTGASPATTRELVGYRASNTVEVRTTDLDNLGATLDAAVAAGGNTIQSIRFEISNNAALLEQAREAAMRDAIAKAEQLTALAGAELGAVLTIEEQGQSRPSPVFAEEAALAAGERPVPVQAGTETVEARVRVSWTIE